MAIGTAATIAGIASSAVGAGMSFAQANAQKKAMKAADDKAAQYMADARRRLEVNYMDELAINKEPYQREREAMLAAGAQAMQASVEGSERGAAANTGRILAAQQQAQGDIRDQMNRDLFNLEAASAEEESRLRDAQAQLDMGEAAGAQQASADAAAARQAALSQGIQGAVNTVSGLIQLPSLYGTNKVKGPSQPFTAPDFTPAQQSLINPEFNLSGLNQIQQNQGVDQFGNIPQFGQMNRNQGGTQFGQTNYNPFELPNTPRYTF
jgi:hypothetical protein